MFLTSPYIDQAIALIERVLSVIEIFRQQSFPGPPNSMAFIDLLISQK